MGDGNVFALGARRPGGLGEPPRLFGPQHVSLSAAHALDELADGFVVVEGNPLAELLLRGDAAHAQIAAELRLCAVGEQVAELAFLYFGGVLAEIVDLPEPAGEVEVYESCECGHVRWFGLRATVCRQLKYLPILGIAPGREKTTARS